MMPKTLHELKTIEPYFSMVLKEEKTFEVRKNDRNFKEGDYIILRHYDAEKKIYSGWFVACQVTYVLYNCPGLDSDYVAMGIELLAHGADYDRSFYLRDLKKSLLPSP